MNRDALICTECDQKVSLCLGYDGYQGRCECRFLNLSIDGTEKPTMWKSWGDLATPINFKVRHKGHIHNGEVIEDSFVECLRCNETDNVEMESEEVDIDNIDLKVTFTCDNEHGMFNNQNISVAYYNTIHRMGESVKDMLRNR